MKTFAVWAPVLLAVWSAGCAGYHVAGRGGTASLIPPNVKTIAIPQFGNETSRPQLDQRVSEALVNEFVRRGRVQATADVRGADAVLEGTIETYRTAPVSFLPSGRYDRVEVTVTARIRLVQSSPEKILWAQNHFIFRSQYDLPESAVDQIDQEIIAIDQIAADFARAVATSILEGM